MNATLEPIARLERDIKKAASTLGRQEARYLTDTYYSLQDFRMQSANQVRAILKSQDEDQQKEPHATLQFFFEQFAQMEKQIQSALDTYSNSQPAGRWAREVVGVGPVIAAGLLAHIDITKAPYASSVHRYAGLVPGQKKEKGVKRDWNSSLKVLCWKLGDSFVKQSGRENCYYGHLYRERKEYELARDLAGGNREECIKTLAEKNIQDKETRAAYESGHLPPGRLDMRARRYAVKRFLTHYWQCLWILEYDTQPPNPWIQEYGGHQHIDEPPVPLPPLRKS